MNKQESRHKRRDSYLSRLKIDILIPSDCSNSAMITRIAVISYISVVAVTPKVYGTI